VIEDRLYLRNLEHQYDLIKGKRFCIYYDNINNNLIIFSPYDQVDNVENIYNGIKDSAYEYLMNELNTHDNIVVHWSKIEGTTSDYTIYYDFNEPTINNMKNKTYKEIIKLLPSGGHMKYNEIKNGVIKPIGFRGEPSEYLIDQVIH